MQASNATRHTGGFRLVNLWVAAAIQEDLCSFSALLPLIKSPTLSYQPKYRSEYLSVMFGPAEESQTSTTFSNQQNCSAEKPK